MARECFGFTGKTLRINLTSRAVTVEDNAGYFKEWLGCGGYAAKIIYDEVREWVTPFEPANKIIFSAGALMGTLTPGACKMNISTIGPMTGGWSTGSSDSYVGMELKHAGYDSVIVEGRAHTPCYLWITDEQVEIRDAAGLWGLTTWETLEAVRRELNDDKLHIISIGPAGENLVRGACIIQDQNRAFGRCGSGAVMGSKNLKAVVCRGKKPIRVADPERFMKKAMACWERIKNSPDTDRFRKYGTLGLLQHKQDICGIPYKNGQDCKFPDDVAAKIEPIRQIEKYQVARKNFPSCPIGCSRHMEITDGPWKGLETECTQWETFGTVQGRLAVSEPTFMFKANAHCNQLGLDVNAAGGSIAWAMECYQREIITKEDTDGMALEWGDADTILELIRKISYREGFGNILAEGCMRAATLIGRNSDYYAIHIKGQDLYESCRASLGWCLGVVTSTRGGGHTTGTPGYEQTGVAGDGKRTYEIFGIKGVEDPLEYDGKAELTYYFEMLNRISNSLGICHQNTLWNRLDYMNLDDIAELLSAATGTEFTVDDLKEIAMRQINLEKAINLRFTDFSRKDDLPTPRDRTEPLASGKLAGWKMDMDKFNKMLDRYYELHGWDKETGYPTRETLAKYGLAYVADELAAKGKLGQNVQKRET